MSGHSKWSQIKYQKGAEDKKRGQLFSKLSRQLTLAAREGSGDPTMNAKLRPAIEKAKEANMPLDNIERAIRRGTGGLQREVLQEALYEAYGPGGVALLIETITDNKNRTLQEIKHLLGKYGGKLAEPKSVQFLFERKGIIRLPLTQNLTREEMELAAIEAGADDIKEEGEELLVVTKPEEAENVKQKLVEKHFTINEIGIEFLPLSPISIPEESKKGLWELFSQLDQHQDVQEIYSNIQG